MIPPKIVALGRIVISLITIDYLPYVVSNALGLLTSVFSESPCLMPVLQNATVTIEED